MLWFKEAQRLKLQVAASWDFGSKGIGSLSWSRKDKLSTVFSANLQKFMGFQASSKEAHFQISLSWILNEGQTIPENFLPGSSHPFNSEKKAPPSKLAPLGCRLECRQIWIASETSPPPLPGRPKSAVSCVSPRGSMCGEEEGEGNEFSSEVDEDFDPSFERFATSWKDASSQLKAVQHGEPQTDAFSTALCWLINEPSRTSLHTSCPPIMAEEVKDFE